jgi:hypothetical protein
MLKITTTMIHPETGEIMYETENVKTVVLDNKHIAYLDSNTGDYCVACFNKQIMDVHYYNYFNHCLPKADYLYCACETVLLRKSVPL